jgi:hypothetical protein
MGELERHVAQAAEADDADLLSRADLPVLQRRPGGDAGAEQWSGGGGVELGRKGEGVMLVDDDVVGVAAVGEFALIGLGIVGADHALLAAMTTSLGPGSRRSKSKGESGDVGEWAAYPWDFILGCLLRVMFLKAATCIRDQRGGVERAGFGGVRQAWEGDDAGQGNHFAADVMMGTSVSVAGCPFEAGLCLLRRAECGEADSLRE